ncbi:hypothetical protein [Tenacibaculum piscium]|uniref:hypothetical protein n=1 Tax=Tenacibaculum piscium TaxID=1458515 RepID=UPI00187B7203|nr:hypothetical protein [Tenacibaculum piscium]MBE7691168.1 hypothetical protein [Tenacibaculum piscium]
MNSYRCSDGSRLTQPVIEKLIKKAKKYKVIEQFDEHGYNFCENCKQSNGTYIDCSHDVSVKKAKEIGKTELCFSVDNITMLCRDCHKKKDGLSLEWSSLK